MALTTLADLKTFLGIAQSDTTQDALLTMFKDSVEQSVIDFCETDFTSKAITNEILDGGRQDVIVPKMCPILSVQGVWIGTQADGSGGIQLDATRDYYADENAITLRYGLLPFARGCVRVDYTWGYNGVPANVKMCVYQSVKAEMQRHQRNTEDLSSRSKGDESEGYGTGSSGVWDELTGLPKTIVAKLQGYKRYEFPSTSMAQRNS